MLHLCVADVDRVTAQAVAAGVTVGCPVHDRLPRKLLAGDRDGACCPDRFRALCFRRRRKREGGHTRGIELIRQPLHEPVAQPVEQLTFNQ